MSSRKSLNQNSQDEISSKNNGKGEVTIEITDKGFWYIATMYMTSSSNPDLDYISCWATLTVEID